MITLNNELMEFIIKNSMEGISIVDKNGKIVMFNDKHEYFSCNRDKEYLGMNMKTLVENGVLDASSSLMVIETKKPMVLEQRIYPDAKDEKVVMIKSIPYLDQEGDLQYVVNYVMDINEKYKLIKELEKALFNNEKYIIELNQIRKSTSATSPIIHRSVAMHNILERVEKIANTDTTVLITGESGTGKTLLAKYIHTKSLRSEKSFLSINCGAIPSNLVESELFGYEKGAFSGANITGKKGLLDYADGGTLLLDEIGEMPYDIQVKLLGVLQTGEFYRIGGTKPIKVDIRIIAATNTNLQEKIERNQFREDLYYRLNVISFKVPPLRERREDIAILVDHICMKNNKKYNSSKAFAPRAVGQLMRMKLKGNIRELENIIERNMIFSLDDIIQDIVMYDEFEEFDDPQENKPQASKNQDNTPQLQNQITKKQYVGEASEKEALIKAYTKFGTTTAMAGYFGVSQSTISRRLKKYDIKKPL